MGSMVSRKLAGLSIVMLIALLAVRLDGLKHAADDCSAGKPYCYDAPVHLDSPINTPGFEGKPALSADGLELYLFPIDLVPSADRAIRTSTSPGGTPSTAPGARRSAYPLPFQARSSTSRRRSRSTGLRCTLGSNRPGPFSPPWPDLWVSHRASVNHPWGPAVNLGAGINTPLFEGSIDISPDQRTVFFAAVTPDFVFDIFMARRSSTDEPFGARVKLTPPINSEGHDYGPALTPDGHTMFFSSGTDNPFAPGAINHLYVSERQNDRAPWGPRIYLDTLNCPTCFGGLPTIRAGGKEICWMGDRGDSFGDKDIYCATRR